MNHEQSRERSIAESWRINAPAWTRAVRNGRIASRCRVTDRAVLEAVMDGRPATALDAGCGEGWLVRAMIERGVDARGIDASPDLVEDARLAGGRFDVATYAEVADAHAPEPVDAFVCNFSLLGETSTHDGLRAASRLLAPAGRLVVQTLHPPTACGDAPYADGWRDGSWEGFPPGFTEPAPWYFRTLESWQALFAAHGLVLVETREPADPDTGAPVSVIFIARLH